MQKKLYFSRKKKRKSFSYAQNHLDLVNNYAIPCKRNVSLIVHSKFACKFKTTATTTNGNYAVCNIVVIAITSEWRWNFSIFFFCLISNCDSFHFILHNDFNVLHSFNCCCCYVCIKISISQFAVISPCCYLKFAIFSFTYEHALVCSLNSNHGFCFFSSSLPLHFGTMHLHLHTLFRQFFFFIRVFIHVAEYRFVCNALCNMYLYS